MKKEKIYHLFEKYYQDNPELKRIVLLHSEQVAKKALKINDEKNLSLDPEDIYCAAMLHDIGVVKCNAPSIRAHGELPYLCHGIEGEKILEENGWSKFASVCSTHTGSGLTKKEIIKNNLPLPPRDFLPETLLEKLICYSDKFYSKSNDLSKEKSLKEVINQMTKFGPDSLTRFMELHSIFGEVN